MTPPSDLWSQNHGRFHVDSAGLERTGLMKPCKAISELGGTATLEWPTEPVSETSLGYCPARKLNLRLIAAKNIFLRNRRNPRRRLSLPDIDPYRITLYCRLSIGCAPPSGSCNNHHATPLVAMLFVRI
jgi:hypothetical protein